MRLFKRVLEKTILTCFRVMLMKMKNMKDLNLKVL